MIKYKISEAFITMVKYTLMFASYLIVLMVCGSQWALRLQEIHIHDKIGFLVMVFIGLPLLTMLAMLLPAMVLLIIFGVLLVPMLSTLAFIAWAGLDFD